MYYEKRGWKAPTKEAERDLMLKYPFATVITHHDQKTEVSHLPTTFLTDEGKLGTVYCHFARAHPHWIALDAGAECILVFKGPQSYISGDWYPEDAEDHLPTWNYATVHVFGKAERIDDPAKVFWQMDQLHRANDQGPLTRVSDEEKSKMIPQVVLFRIPIDRVESIFKLNQNRAYADAEKAMKELQKSAVTEKQELATLMRLSLEKRNEDKS